jgi:capsular exopolysaccharide synthesis family protein
LQAQVAGVCFHVYQCNEHQVVDWMAASPNHTGNGAVPASNGQPRLYDEALLEAGARSSSLREWIGLLWSGKWIILGVALLAVLCTGLYIYSIPDTYRTSTLLYVDRDQRSVAAQFGQRTSSFMRQDNTLENELFLLRYSTVIAERVARRLTALGRHPRTGEALPILVGPEGDSLSMQAAAGRIRGSVQAYPAAGESVNAMRIRATTGSPAQTALIANLYADEYIERTKERSRERMRASRQFLEKQARTLKKDLRAVEGEIEQYMQTHEAVSLDQASSRVVQRIADLQAQRSELRIELDMKRAALRDLKAELADAEPKLAEQLSSSLNERLQRVQKEKAELESRIDLVERRNPGLDGGGTRARELQQMRARVRRLQQKADSLARAYVEESLAAGVGGEETTGVDAVAQKQQRVSQLRIEVGGLEARLDVVEQRLAEQRETLQSIPEQSMQLAQLQRERRSTEQIYGFVREKLQETRLSEESEVGFAEVVQAAGISRVPIGPDLTKNLVLALILGLGLGGMIVIVWAKLDTHVRQPDDLKSKGYSLSGVVPPMGDLIYNQFGGNEEIEVDGRTVRTELVLLTSPMSAAAEAYRRIRTNLQFARPDATVQTIAMTSAEQGEGKTTTVANLALAFASAGKNTLLIDADLRHPRLHNVFGVGQEPGLSHLLFDRSIETDAFATSIDHLSVLPAGEAVPNPAELLESERMGTLLEELKAQYDIVLLDTPPVLLFSDALALSSHCDGTLLVAAAGRSDGRAVDHAAEQIKEIGGTLLSCVLNRYEGESALYGYGTNYGYAQGNRQLAEYYRTEETKTVAESATSWWRRS